MSTPNVAIPPQGAPASWDKVLAGPCFLVNMDRCPERLAIATDRIRAAGFSGAITRVRGLDRDRDGAEIAAEWARLLRGTNAEGRFQDRDGFPTNLGKQACALAHYGIWERILAEGLDFAVVFEDDVLFHKHWAQLAPWFYENTPKDFDLLYLGSSFDVRSPDPILRTPVFCTHAMVVTRRGAQRALDICLRDPRGTWTIDWMLREVMMGKDRKRTLTLDWYVWNGVPWHDERAFTSTRWQENIKNQGLVFQDHAFGSFIDAEVGAGPG